MAKTATERKRDQRKREEEHRAKMEAELFSMDIYKGTRKALDQLKQDHGFEDDGEIVTRLIHNLKDCDMSRQSELLKVPQA